MAVRSALGMGRARPPQTKATRTCASTRSSSARRICCLSVIEAPFTSSGAVTTSSTSSMRAGLRNSICIEHHEGKTRRLRARFFEQRAMTGAEQAQMIGAPALHEAQISGVIDDAGKIGVLVIDANGHDVTAAPNFAVESVHRHGTRLRIAASQFLPLNGRGEIALRSMSSRQRALTSILSGSERGT